MADLSITAASVVAGSDATTDRGFFGETVTAGQAVYKEAATNYWKKADSDSATAEVRASNAIALNGGAVGQPVVVQKGGKITIGATLTPGLAYYLSKTPGGICPVADIASGGYAEIIGIATSATELALDFKSSGVAV